MKFSINYSNLDRHYRLKKGKEWRKIESLNVTYEDDILFQTPQEAENAVYSFKNIHIGEENINPHDDAVSLGGYIKSVIAHRTEMPQYTIKREDIKEIIEKGDDSFENVLVIDFDGRPQLIKLIDDDARNNVHFFPVRNEHYQAGNGYVGNEQSADDIENLYLSLLENWIQHLGTGKSFYVDYYDNKTEIELLSELKDVLRKFNN